MKNIIALLLALAMCFSLCACGKSEAVTNVEGLIDAIGEVSTESESAIIAAEEAYNALAKEEKTKVENYSVLTEARAALDDAIKAAEYEALKAPFVGTWISEFVGEKKITLNADGTGVPYDWTISEDGTKLTIGGEVGTVIIEDEYTKLLFVNSKDCYVRAEDYQEAYDRKFMAVEVTGENVKDYLGDPVLAGYELDAWGEVREGCTLYFLTSKVYEDGWVYIGCSDDFAVDIVYSFGFTMTHTLGPFSNIVTLGDSPNPVRIGDRAKGTLYYVREEYVAENYLSDTNGLDGHTELILTNGIEYTTATIFANNGSYNGVSFDYQDFLR